MNKELIFICDSIRDWAVPDKTCKGRLLNIRGDLYKLWKCSADCHSCVLSPWSMKSTYQGLIIQTFSQLNK